MIPPRLLAAYPFLGEISASSRALVAQGVLRIYKRSQPIIRRGDTIGGMLLILSGRVRIYTISDSGEEATLYTVERGESCLLSTSALFAEMSFPAWVEVETEEVKIFCIPATEFRKLYHREPAVRDFTVTELSGRVFQLVAALEERATQSVDGRLKGYLRRCADANGEVLATHEQIALSLGTAREVVSRKLSLLGRAGQIETRRGRIRILRPKAFA